MNICCHIGTCTYFYLESEITQWMAPFCSSMGNWLDTRQYDLGGASIANEHLPTASNAYELFEAVTKRRIGYTANCIWRCVGGVEMDVQSYGAFNTSFATYRRVYREFIDVSL